MWGLFYIILLGLQLVSGSSESVETHCETNDLNNDGQLNILDLILAMNI